MKLKQILSLIVFWIFFLRFGNWVPSIMASSFAEDAVAMCSLHATPSDVKDDLSKNFANWKIQEPNNLSDAARERWNAEEPLTCPGIAVGRFANARLSYAFLLVAQQQPSQRYKFVVFDPTERNASFDMRILENSGSGARDAFIHTVQISAFADEGSKKTFHMESTDGILLIDASANEYESDLYFWTGHSYMHSPVDN